MKHTGKLVMKLPITTVGANATTKQQVVINNEETKVQMCIDFLGDNVKKLEWIEQWTIVEADFTCSINVWTWWAIFNRITWHSILDISPIE